MLKLVSLNVEGLRHLDRVEKFLTEQMPDCICLMEMPACFIYKLTVMGYYPIFAPSMRETGVSSGEVLGVCIATRTPAQTEINYYDGTKNGILPEMTLETITETNSCPVIFSKINHTDGQEYHIASTHVIVSLRGKENPVQTKSVEKLLAYLSQKPTHIICGDFNIPRGYNTNYELLTEHYTDMIPKTFTSSLDRTLHKAANNPNLNAPIFDIYMVDYIFSKEPYLVNDVKMQFGISDHAGIIATITK